MRVLVEQIKPGVSAHSSTMYFTFWVRLMDPRTGWWMSISGWRYYPERRQLSGPSISKGNGSYVDTVKYDAELRNEIQRQIEAYVGAEEPEPVAA
jgi:hypothetical protein